MTTCQGFRSQSKDVWPLQMSGGGGKNNSAKSWRQQQKSLTHKQNWLLPRSPKCSWCCEKRVEPAWVALRVLVSRSRLDFLGDNGEDDVLVAPPHHSPQRVIPLDGGTHVTGRVDWLAIDADDDITLLQASTVATEMTEKTNKCCWCCNICPVPIGGGIWNSAI